MAPIGSRSGFWSAACPANGWNSINGRKEHSMKKRSWLARTVTAGVTVVVFTVTAVCPPPARAGVGLFATEITQLLNHVELIDQYVEQVQMVGNQLTQIQNMIRNTTVNPSQVFGSVAQD